MDLSMVLKWTMKEECLNIGTSGRSGPRIPKERLGGLQALSVLPKLLRWRLYPQPRYLRGEDAQNLRPAGKRRGIQTEHQFDPFEATE